MVNIRSKPITQYVPLNNADQHEKNRILAQMEADRYWKRKTEYALLRGSDRKTFDPLAFRFKVSRYAWKHHTTKHELVRMSKYCQQLLKQGMVIKARLKHIKGVAS